MNVALSAIDIAFAPDGKSIAVGGIKEEPGSRGIVQIWDLPSRRRSVYELRQSFPHSVAFSPDGRLLIVGCGNGYGPAEIML
jgi:WD40 repeat protein